MKSYIWSLPTRVFHWLFAVLILLAFLTDDDKLLNYHALIGYGILTLLVFRFFWGYLGPKYSKFKDFPMAIKDVKEFIVNIFNPKQKYIGHNPIASYVMIGIFIVAFITILTGILTFGVQEGKGLLSSLNSTFFKKMELFEDIHEFLSGVLIALIVLHLLGILSDRVLHAKHETLKSIFSGYKVTDENEGIKLNIFQKLIAALFLVIFIAFLLFNLTTPSNPLIASMYKPIDYKKQNELFVKECASCHTLYPPHTLPKRSWLALMSNLENHFEDDASLSEEENKNILDFLLKNSAESSTQEVSVKILDSLKNKDIIAITHTDFFKTRHKDISKKVFECVDVKSKANCKACHSDIEQGLIEDDKIKNIRAFM
ncbi:MAG: cytochrome b/b6 domain-containing protein [Sulfurimonas sp.]|uniref:cytochrome b/b6 domain-containing protein n=1 Tax=Sulfurimonas sp. TaxID=2022749 RepID=UPI0025ED281D|nr:cytochrome b/b6 domain-containing protein [Sulfurimonas sp.]MCK9491382.1 cytochrome b/b6 domain-containing protein [Sulfurimonas sp.]